MGNTLSNEDIRNFLKEIDLLWADDVDIYLIGGSALSMFGNTRPTVDIDFHMDTEHELAAKIETLSAERNVFVDIIEMHEFVPIPAGQETRHVFIDQIGSLKVYMYDPLSIALGKLGRAFEEDIEDIQFMVDKEMITLKQLEDVVEQTKPVAWDFDIDPEQLANSLELLKGGS